MLYLMLLYFHLISFYFNASHNELIVSAFTCPAWVGGGPGPGIRPELHPRHPQHPERGLLPPPQDPVADPRGGQQTKELQKWTTRDKSWASLTSAPPMLGRIRAGGGVVPGLCPSDACTAHLRGGRQKCPQGVARGPQECTDYEDAVCVASHLRWSPGSSGRGHVVPSW